jgi:predicted flap endonuclease-1-like 5' DNA nuclease
MASIKNIEGIGPAYAQKLAAAGISTTGALLKKGATPHGRKEIETTTGISNIMILRWVNMADLFRIKGVAEEYADLLEAAGIDTVPELAQRNAANLYAKLLTVNEEKQLVRQLPGENRVENWIEQAQTLKRVVTY